MKKYTSLQALYAAMRALCSDSKMIFLPNPVLTTNIGSIDYCLIGMEPSTKGEIHTQEESDHSRNFYASIEDLILHYCAWRYLCKENFNYHITDLCKGEMLTKAASRGRSKRWEEWLPYLMEELRLLRSTRTVIIGKGLTAFLQRNQPAHFSDSLSVIHYSPVASRWIKKEFEDGGYVYTEVNEKALQGFYNQHLSTLSDLRKVVISKRKKMDHLVSSFVLTNHQKQLISIYKTQFLKYRK